MLIESSRNYIIILRRWELKINLEDSIPSKIRLMNETHAFRIWDACLVLVRPDGFSAWRSDSLYKVHNASQVLLQAIGHTSPL